MTMLIDDLIHQLEEMREEYGGDCEVRMAIQESWPFEHSIRGIVSRENCQACEDYIDNEDEPVVWLVEGRQLGYFTRSAWDAV